MNNTITIITNIVVKIRIRQKDPSVGKCLTSVEYIEKYEFKLNSK